MSKWTPFSYREFYDVPRAIIVSDNHRTYFFDCPFDEQRDDYPPDYDVYLMPTLSQPELNGSWVSLKERGLRRLGRVPVSRVRFDESRRREIDLKILEQVERV